MTGRARAAALPVAFAVTATSLAVRARYGEPFSPVLEQVSVTGDGATPASACLRVGFVTDTHVGPTLRATDVDRAMALLVDVSPDLLLYGGDFVCESPRYIPEVVAALREYELLPRLGAFAVFGNHDYANDAPRLRAALEQIGIRVLQNDGGALSVGDRHFWIAGIDDAVLGHPEAEMAFADRPAGTFAIALWHEPDWAERAAALGADLQLSGHSHGGQIRLPVVGNVAAPFGGRRFVSGLNNVSGMPVYTSRGVGAYRPPIRLRCPPEVTLLEIRPTNDG